MNLKTTPTIKEAREIAKLTFNWCTENLGIKEGQENVKLRMFRTTFNPAYENYRGQFFSKTLTVVVYLENISSIKELIDTIIHEYRHYLQGNRFRYNNSMHSLSYWHYVRLPAEKDANKCARKNYSKCWKFIKPRIVKCRYLTAQNVGTHHAVVATNTKAGLSKNYNVKFNF